MDKRQKENLKRWRKHGVPKRILESKKCVHDEMTKRNNICQICGIQDKRVLIWHHIRDKISTIASMVQRQSKQTVQKELDKCVLICANCHLIVHHNQRKEYKWNKTIEKEKE